MVERLIKDVESELTVARAKNKLLMDIVVRLQHTMSRMAMDWTKLHKRAANAEAKAQQLEHKLSGMHIPND